MFIFKNCKYRTKRFVLQRMMQGHIGVLSMDGFGHVIGG